MQNVFKSAQHQNQKILKVRLKEILSRAEKNEPLPSLHVRRHHVQRSLLPSARNVRSVPLSQIAHSVQNVVFRVILALLHDEKRLRQRLHVQMMVVQISFRRSVKNLIQVHHVLQHREHRLHVVQILLALRQFAIAVNHSLRLAQM